MADRSEAGTAVAVESDVAGIGGGAGGRGAGVSRLLKRQGSLQDAIFGVLYTLSKEKMGTSWKISSFEVFIHFLQLFLIMFSTVFPWDFDSVNWMKSLLKLEIVDFLTRIGYNSFLVVFWIEVAILAISIGICAYVAHNFKSGKFPWVWPIKAARLFVSVFFATFYVTSLAIVIMGLYCRSSDGSPPSSGIFEDKRCDTMPHAMVVAVAVPSAICVIAVAFLMTVAESALDPLAHDVLATVFTHATARVFVSVTVIDIASILIRDYPLHFGVVSSVLFGYCTWVMFRFVPYLVSVVASVLFGYCTWVMFPFVKSIVVLQRNMAVNFAEAGVYGVLTWIAVMLSAVTVVSEGTADNKQDRVKFLTLLAVYGCLPVFAAVALLVRLRMSRFFRIATSLYLEPAQLVVPNTNRRASMTGPNKASRGGGLPGERKPWADIEAMVPHHRFWGEEEVEATARCMRWTDRFGNYDEGWVTAAELAIRMGIAQFPDSYRLSMLYANFLIDVRRSGAQGTNVLARVKKMSANMDVRFQGFCRDREQTQRGGSGSVGAEGAMDLVSFVEFHNNFKSVQKSHGTALRVIRRFWRKLITSEVGFVELSDILSSLSMVEARALKVYRLMLERYPTNVKLLRSYGRFMEEVQNNPWRALRSYEEAEKIEDMQAEAKRDALLGEMGGEGDGDAAVAVADDTVDGVIVISDAGIINMTNRVLNDLFGYKMGELEGMNISMLMPPPFSQQHNSYLRSYKLTGRAKVIGTRRVLTAMHKDRSVFPIWLAVSKVQSPDGQDQFMGVINPVAVDLRKGILYTTIQGSMLCANLGFTDNYGYRSSDILGQVVTSLGPAESRWEEELASIQERVERLTEEAARAVADAAQKGRGSSQRDRAVGMRGSMDKADARHSAEDGTHQEDALASLRFHFSERVRHKFSRAVIPVEVVVALGGTDTTRLLEMTITPTEVQDGVAVFDTAGRLVYVNKEVETLLHYRPGMMLRKEITLDRCLPPPYNQFHSKQLKDLFVRAEQPGLDIPCYNNHVIPMVGRGKRLTAARMRWWPSKDTGPLLFVSVISAPPADPLAGLWEAEGPQGAINRQICLRVVTTAHGKVVAVGGGVGFHRRGLPGDVFGMDASSMLGESLSSYVDMMDTAVRNAQRYNAGVTTEQVMEEFIGSLSAKARALDIASYRACFIADDSGDEDATVPIRLVVQPVSSSPLRLSALADHGVLLKDHATPGAIAALEEEGYVFEIWSSNWLNADLTLSRDLAIRAVSPALEVMCGRRAKALAGKPASELLTESGLEGLEGVVKGSAREMCEIKHLDGSAIGVSVAGAQKQVGQREVQVLLRGVLEEGSSAMESLRRAEGLLALETGRAKEDGPRKSKGKVSFGQGVVEKDERKERKESGDGGAEKAKEAEEEDDDEEEEDDNEEDDEGTAQLADGRSETGMSEGASEAASDASRLQSDRGRDHFRRAKRFRRLKRFLKMAPTQGLAELLVWRVAAAAGVALAVHVLIFALLVVSVRSSDAMVTSALESGDALHWSAVVLTDMRLLQDTAGGGQWAVEGEDVAAVKGELLAATEVFEDRYEAQYIGNQQQGRAIAPRDRVFEEPELPVVVFQDTTPPSSISKTVSLLELAEEVAQKALLVHDMTDAQLADSESNRHWLFVFTNTKEPLLPALDAVLKATSDEVLGSLEDLQTDMVIIAVLQSILVVPLVALVVWVQLRSLTHSRLAVFNVFLAVPKPVLWTLSMMDVSMEGGQGNEAEGLDVEWSRKVELSKEEMRIAELLMKKSSKSSRVAKALQVQGVAGSLPVESNRKMWKLCVPLLVMSAVTLCLHMAGFAMISGITPPIRNEIIIAEIKSDVSMARFRANELVLKPESREENAALLAERLDHLQHLWDALVFGDEELGLDGAGYASYATQKLLFNPQCLRVDGDPCLEPGHPYHTMLSEGLDRAMRGLLNEGRLLANEPPFDPASPEASLSVRNTHFQFVWIAAEHDVLAGIDRLADIQLGEADDVLSGVIAIEAALFVLLVAMALVYMVVARPYVTMVQEELNAVAKMLSYLPEGMAVEQIVQDVLEIKDTAEGSQDEQLSVGMTLLRKSADLFARLLLGRRYKLFLQFERIQAEQKKRARMSATKAKDHTAK